MTRYTSALFTITELVTFFLKPVSLDLQGAAIFTFWSQRKLFLNERAGLESSDGQS